MGRDFGENLCRWIASTHFSISLAGWLGIHEQQLKEETNNKMNAYYDEDFYEVPQDEYQPMYDEEYIKYMVQQYIDQLSDYMEGK